MFCLDVTRLGLGFTNPNHAAAALCALLPLCWGWRRHAWLGYSLAAALFAMLLLTQSRTGILVAGLEAAAWWWFVGRRAGCTARAPRRRRWPWAVAGLAVVGFSLWWLGPRLALDGSILNRPKIWLAGLRLFAANPGGVGLCNSGTLASAFLLDDGVPEVRTLVNAHLTLLAECGWFVGWAWGAFIALALTGLKESPRIGFAFAGLVASGCSATVFDWAVLLDFAEQGGLEWTNWILSWGMFAFFIGCGTWLVWSRTPRAEAARVQRAPGSIVFALACSGALVLAARLVPPGNAPRVRDGYAFSGDAAGRARGPSATSASLRGPRSGTGASSPPHSRVENTGYRRTGRRLADDGGRARTRRVHPRPREGVLRGGRLRRALRVLGRGRHVAGPGAGADRPGVPQPALHARPRRVVAEAALGPPGLRWTSGRR